MDADGQGLLVKCMGMEKNYWDWGRSVAVFHYRVTL